MSNFSTFTPLIPAYCGTNPNVFSASTPDNLSTITATGYLNDIAQLLKLNDIVIINYLDTSIFPLNPGENSTLGTFRVIVGGGNTSLVEDESSIYPVMIDSQGNMSGIHNINMTGSITQSASLPGATLEHIIINQSTQSGSDAALILQTTSNLDGTEGGSPYIEFVQSNYQFWLGGVWPKSDGGDNNFHINNGEFSNNDLFILQPGVMNVTGNIVSQGNTAGVMNYVAAINHSATANSNAILLAQTESNSGGTLGGSPYTEYIQNNYQVVKAGIYSQENGGDNLYHIAYTDFGSNNPIIIAPFSPHLTVNGNQLITGTLCQVLSNNSGQVNYMWVENTGTGIGSGVQCYLRTESNSGGTIGGSVFTSYVQNNYQSYGSGIWSAQDGGDGKFHIGHGGSSGFLFTSTDPMILDSSGNVVFNGTVNGVNLGSITSPYAAGIGNFTGSSVTQVFPITGMVPGDVIVALVATVTGLSSVQIISATAGSGAATITWSATPSAATFNYVAYHP